MLSSKKHILELVALLRAYHVRDIVISPGSRNAPLIQTFSEEDSFRCHVIVDERNAAFYALGIIQATRKPVAVCCTSGTAMLNYAAAVAEAFYQELPLIIISADRPQEWIGQMDGQTIPQVDAYGSLVRKSIQLEEIKSEQDLWYCNRIINEALIANLHPNPSPVHINIAINEPLFDYSVASLPDVRKIQLVESKKRIDTQHTGLNTQFRESSKRMIIIGQMPKISSNIRKLLLELEEKLNCVILCEHLSNCYNGATINNFDPILYRLSDGEKMNYSPDMLITFGGHIISKRLKQFLRNNKPKTHWHLTPSGEIVDLYQGLTDVIETDIEDFLAQLIENSLETKGSDFLKLWKNASKEITEPNETVFSDISVVGGFLEKLPKRSALHLANSSAVRHAQLFKLDQSIEVFCNRGTNGIESSLPSAIGFASVYDKPSYLIIGDLSFFYTVGALWNMEHIKNLRILLLNNSSGGIFHTIPVLNRSSSMDKYVAAEHNNTAEKWADAAGLKYISVNNQKDLNEALAEFTNEKMEQSIILEVKLDIEICKSAMKEYYHQFKK